MTIFRSFSVRRMVAAVAVLVSVSSAAKADIVIDDFTTPNPAIPYSLAAAVPSTYSQTDGNRSVTVTQIGNDFGTSNATGGLIGTTPFGGRFILSTATGATAYANLVYSYATPLNLSSGSTLKFSFTSTDLNVPFSVVVTSGSSSSTQVGLVSSPTALSFDLTGFAGVDLTAVSSIELVLNKDVLSGASTTSADFSISTVTVTTPVVNTAVPAPPALLLGLVALPVLGLRRKFAAKA
jgi:hypothetical protein